MINSSLDNFRQKQSPEVCSSRMGSGAGEVLAPKGIAIDLCTDNIFIADAIQLYVIDKRQNNL